MTQAEYARHRGVSAVAVLKAIRSGRITVIERDGAKLIDAELADIQWARNTKGAAPLATLVQPTGRAEPPPEVAAQLYDMTEARARREHHEANLAAMREAEKAGGLLPREGVMRAATEAGAIFRQAVERITALSTELAAESDPIRIRNRLESVLRDALNEAADRLSTLGTTTAEQPGRADA